MSTRPTAHIRQDLQDEGLSVPIGNRGEMFWNTFSIPYRWVGENFQVFWGGWKDAYSIDFDFDN